MQPPARGSVWLNWGFCVIAALGCGRRAADTAPPQEAEPAAAQKQVSRTPQDQYGRSDPSNADAELSRHIREAMMEDDRIAASAPGVEIGVNDGEVTLRGTVQDQKQRAAIVGSAQQIAGLTKVINLLELAHSDTAGAPSVR
jgi:osmotically-inducible protein OsmY